MTKKNCLSKRKRNDHRFRCNRQRLHYGRSSESLEKQGVTTAIVDLGGNVYVLGHSPRGENQDWTVGIQDPNMARGSVLGSIKERNKTLVTSGIYERYLEVDGKNTIICLIQNGLSVRQ